MTRQSATPARVLPGMDPYHGEDERFPVPWAPEEWTA